VNRRLRVVLIAVLAVAMIGGAGCIRRNPRVQDDRAGERTHTAPLNGATALNADLSMAAGELTITGADIAPDAVRGHFEYAPAILEPEITSSIEGSTTRVAVEHPDAPRLDFADGDMRSSWDVTLPTTVPTELAVRIGAGEADVDLRGLNLTSFKFEQGAGETTIDLSGQSSALTADATIGAGEITVKLPARVGVRVRGYRDGIGDWSYPDFRVEGDYLVNDAYGTPGVATIDLDVQRAVGQVNLVEVP